MESLAILSRIIKKTNIDMIDKLCEMHNVYPEEKEQIKKECIKPNYYNVALTKYSRNETK